MDTIETRAAAPLDLRRIVHEWSAKRSGDHITLEGRENGQPVKISVSLIERDGELPLTIAHTMDGQALVLA